MPAPFPSATAAPEKLRFWIVTLLCVTRMPLPLGGATVATKFAMPPTPTMVMSVGDCREVIHIGTGLHGDDIAVTRGGDRSGERRIGLPGPNIESCHEM